MTFADECTESVTSCTPILKKHSKIADNNNDCEKEQDTLKAIDANGVIGAVEGQRRVAALNDVNKNHITNDDISIVKFHEECLNTEPESYETNGYGAPDNLFHRHQNGVGNH